MAESFIKRTEYVNLIGIGAWISSQGYLGMVIRSSVFQWENYMKTVTLKKILI